MPRIARIGVIELLILLLLCAGQIGEVVVNEKVTTSSSAREARNTGRSTVQDRSIFLVFQCPFRDLILAREPDVVVAPCVRQETIQHANAVRMSVDPVVHTDQHQAAAAGAFFIELVELVA